MNAAAPDPTGSPLELTLQLEFGERSIRGTLALGDGHAQPFTGWLGLLSALERQRPSVPGRHERGSGDAAVSGSC